MKNFKSGLVSATFRKLSCEEIISLMKENDLKYVEWGSDVHAPENDLDKLSKIASIQNQTDIVCSSYGTYFKIGVSEIKDIYAYIAAAKILGTNVLRLWCSNKSASLFSKEEKESFFDECRRLAEIAENEGVILCMECHPNTFTDSVESALELMENVNSENFRMYYQPNQYKTEEENLEYARLISPYTVNIHIFNWKDADKFPLEDAKDIWKKYLSCFDGDKKILLEFMPDGKVESLEKEANALKEILGGLI